MKIKVCAMGGTDLILDVNPDANVDKVKITAVGGFMDPSETIQNSLYFKLFNVRTGKVLNEESTISKEDVQENGEASFFFVFCLFVCGLFGCFTISVRSVHKDKIEEI